MKNVDRILELQKRINLKMADLEKMKTQIESEGREATPEERKLALELMQQVEGHHADLELEKVEVDLRSKLDKSAREPLKPELTVDSQQERYPGLPPRELRFKSFGEQLNAIVNASQPGGPIDRRLSRAATGMGETIPSDGGFLVQTDFSTELFRRVYETSPVVSRVRRIPVGPNANGLKINAIAETTRVSSILGGIILYWLGEGGTKTPTAPEFRQMELNLKKVAGLYYATDELLQDSTALAAIASDGFSEALDVELERCIVRGSGAEQPLGILNSPCLISQAIETGQTGTGVIADNIIKMWSRLWSRSMPNAVWLISQSILPSLMTMGVTVGVGGSPMWLPPNGLAGAPYGTLMGRPLFAIENCSAVGTVGDIILADLSQYIMIDKGGPQFASSIHVKFIYDETTFRIVFRCDGQPAWNSALTPKDSSSTVGPFVTLAARS